MPTVAGRIDGELLATAGTALKLIAPIGLDVFEHEPAIDFRLQALDNVVLLPHMGATTIEGRAAMGERVNINIKTLSADTARRIG